MPINPTYPGVYVQEIPSGVHTITGVATSITAFVGVAKRGPVNKPVSIFSFSDYERAFGGLDMDSDISYAVNQFFQNGGSQAYVVRLAKNAKRAWITLGDSTGAPVLYIWALDEGTSGNAIQLNIDTKEVIDLANFNITFSYASADNPSDTTTETFKNVSLDSNNPRYVVDAIHNISTLVDVSQDPSELEFYVPDAIPQTGSSTAVANAASSTALVKVGSSIVTGMGPTPGTLTSGVFAANDLNSLPSSSSNTFKIGLDGDPATKYPVTFDTAKPFTGLTDVASRIQTQVQGLSTLPPYKNFTCKVDSSDQANQKLVLTSGTTGHNSQVVVAPGDADIAKALHLDSASSTPGTAGKLPAFLVATGGSLISSGFTADEIASLPSATSNNFKIGLDGDSATTPNTVTFDTTKPFTGNDLASRLTAIAGIIQTQVQAFSKAAGDGYKEFTCTVDDSKTKLVLTSGTTGPDSKVSVAPGNNDIAGALKLFSPDATPTPGAAAGTGRNPASATNGRLTSGAFGPNDFAPLPTTSNSFMISLDGDTPSPVIIDSPPFAGTSLTDRLTDVAQSIQQKVRKVKPALPAYSGFTCAVDPTNTKLILTSGTTDPNISSVVVTSGPSDKDIAGALHLLDGENKPAYIPSLRDGAGDAFTEDDPDYTNIYLGLDDTSQPNGVYALERVDLFNLLCLPGVRDGGILTAALQYCQRRRAFLIVDAPLGPDGKSMKPADISAKLTGPTLLPKADIGTYAAVYYPWVKLPDPMKGGRLRAFPPSGIIAGLYARTDTDRGVWKAPAGIDANLVGAQDLDYVMTDNENGMLNPHGINCIRAFPVYGIVCWGARTISGDDQIGSEYKYVPVRRLALYIEESLYRGSKWIVFEPNDEPLWAQIRLNFGSFMHDLFRKGAFQGQTPKDAYFVKCDKDTTTQSDINHGIVNILVGFAPLKPAEFVIITLQQMAGQIEV